MGGGLFGFPHGEWEGHTHCCPSLPQLLEATYNVYFYVFHWFAPQDEQSHRDCEWGNTWFCLALCTSVLSIQHAANPSAKWGGVPCTKGKAPWAGSCRVKMPSHSHLLKLDLSLGPGRIRTAMDMGEGGQHLGATLYLK